MYWDNGPTWDLSATLFDSAISGLVLGLVFAFVILLFATTNWVMALLAVCNIGAIVCCLLACFVARTRDLQMTFLGFQQVQERLWT